MSVIEAGRRGAPRLIPSLVKGDVETLKALMPQNWIPSAKFIAKFGHGGGSKLGLWGKDATNEEIVNALGRHYKRKYGTMEGFKEALATDPGSIVADVGAVAAFDLF